MKSKSVIFNIGIIVRRSNKMKKLLSMFIILIMIFSLNGCTNNSEPKEITANSDEFIFEIHLNTKEDIYQLAYEYSLGETPIGGGDMMKANGKTKLESPSYIRFRVNNFPDSKDITDFSIMLYISDTLENVGDFNQAVEHTGQYSIGNEIKFTPVYGNIYSITISGDKENGYVAELADDVN